jgi:hypothetical protein
VVGEQPGGGREPPCAHWIGADCVAGQGPWPGSAQDLARQSQIKDSLHLSQAGRARVSEYENGKRTPPLKVVLDYSRLARVPMESLVDDEISLSQLGTFDYEQLLKLEQLAVDKQARKKRVPKPTE